MCDHLNGPIDQARHPPGCNVYIANNDDSDKGDPSYNPQDDYEGSDVSFETDSSSEHSSESDGDSSRAERKLYVSLRTYDRTLREDSDYWLSDSDCSEDSDDSEEAVGK